MFLPNLSYSCRCRSLLVTALIGLSGIAPHSFADTGDTFNVSVGTNFLYDSNVFRLSSLVNPANILPVDARADQIITSSATLSVNKLYSMQRFEFNGSIVDNRYNNFDFLNFIAKNATGAWHWAITPYLHGRVSGSHSESLNNFANLTGFLGSNTRNIRNNNNFHFEGIFEMTRAWHLLGGIDHNTVTNSQLNVQDFDNRVLSVHGGVRYSFPSGSSFTYRIRRGDGEFMKRPEPLQTLLFDNRFNELENELRLIWPITGKTSIEGRVGYLERKYPHFSQRNFAGFVGNFDFNWAATSKTRITASWARNLFNSQTPSRPGDLLLNTTFFQPFSSSYVIINRFSIGPVWKISEKTMLSVRYDYSLRDFHGAVITDPAGHRSDSVHTGFIELDWKPINMVALSATFRKEHRSSNHGGFDYDTTAGSIAARLNF
jgi:exopolysaccharide biosynthesis operon protein EpsL